MAREILGSSETGGIAWRQGQTLWQPFADVQLSQGEDGALRIASAYLPVGHVEHTADAARIELTGATRSWTRAWTASSNSKKTHFPAHARTGTGQP